MKGKFWMLPEPGTISHGGFDVDDCDEVTYEGSMIYITRPEGDMVGFSQYRLGHFSKGLDEEGAVRKAHRLLGTEAAAAAIDAAREWWAKTLAKSTETERRMRQTWPRDIAHAIDLRIEIARLDRDSP